MKKKYFKIFKKLKNNMFLFCSAGIMLLTTGCSFAGVTYQNYVQAVLDCSYHQNYQAYCDMTDHTISEAEALFLNEKISLSTRIRHYYGIKSDFISEEMIQQYDDFAGEILKQTKYTIREVNRTGDVYQVTLILSPVDFWERTAPEIENYYENDFTPKYSRAKTQQKADMLEEVYARQVLRILEQSLKELDYLVPVQYDFTIGTGENSVQGTTWQEIDSILLGYAETASES
ncbi:MAG: hypothetical protein K2H82_05820 [Oscillospiraceae bacterium]|nr:hypothetical protein [Oscillospiraceae bacterium]